MNVNNNFFYKVKCISNHFCFYIKKGGFKWLGTEVVRYLGSNFRGRLFISTVT